MRDPDWSSCRDHTPHSKQLLWLLQWRRSCNCSARTLVPDYWHVWQITDLASRFARGSVANTSACLAGLSKTAALLCQSFDNASLWPEALRPLFFVHTALYTVLTNPELCSTDFSPPVPRVHSNRAHPRRVSMPSCNDTDYIRKMIVCMKNIFRCIYNITTWISIRYHVGQ